MIEPAKEFTTEVARQLSVSTRFRHIAAVFQEAADSALPDQIEQAAAVISTAFSQGRKLLVFGNGGSASDAQHICGELLVRFQKNRRPLPAIALCCDGVVMTACANDYSYEQIFERQINALGTAGDVALGISTSGNSRNVVNGLRAARNLGLLTVLMTGLRAASGSTYCDLVLSVPGPSTARIQELHLASYHIICELIEDRLFGERT